MIKDKAKMKVGLFQVDVNWNKEVTPCKKIRLTFGKKTQIIDHDEFYSMMMLFGNEQEQEALIPTKKREMVLIERMLHVKASKDIKQGELITVPYTYSIDQETYDQMLRDNPRSFRKVDEKKEGVIIK
jgi:hypothetical protein